MENVPMLCLWSWHVMVPSLTDVLLLAFSCSLWTGWGIRREQAGRVRAKNDLIGPSSRGVGNLPFLPPSEAHPANRNSAVALGFVGLIAATEITAMVFFRLGLEVFEPVVFLHVPGWVLLSSDRRCASRSFSPAGCVFIKCVPQPPGGGPTL